MPTSTVTKAPPRSLESPACPWCELFHKLIKTSIFDYPDSPIVRRDLVTLYTNFGEFAEFSNDVSWLLLVSLDKLTKEMNQLHDEINQPLALPDTAMKDKNEVFRRQCLVGGIETPWQDGSHPCAPPCSPLLRSHEASSVALQPVLCHETQPHLGSQVMHISKHVPNPLKPNQDNPCLFWLTLSVLVTVMEVWGTSKSVRFLWRHYRSDMTSAHFSPFLWWY